MIGQIMRSINKIIACYKSQYILFVISILLLSTGKIFSQDSTRIWLDSIRHETQQRLRPAPIFSVGVIDNSDKTVIPFDYEDIATLKSERAIAKRFGLYGVINRSGEVKVPFLFDRIASFLHDRYVVELKNKWGIVGSDGNKIIPFEYDDIIFFDGGNAVVKKGDNYAMLSISGNHLGSFIYNNVESMNDGVAIAMKNHFVGLVDTLGIEKTPFIYDWIYPSTTHIFAAIKDGKYCIVNREGLQLTDLDYNEISSFNEKGYGLARKGSKYGILNDQGTETIPLIYDDMTLYDDCASAKFNNLWGVVDFSGNTRIPFEYQSIKRYYGNLFLVKQNDRWKFIDYETLDVLPMVYESVNSYATYSQNLVSNYRQLYSPARREGKWGLIDMLGQIVAPFVYDGDKIIPLGENLLAIQKGAFYSLADFDGKYITKRDFEDIFTLSDNLVRVKDNGKYGIVNNAGVLIVDCIYDNIFTLAEGSYYAVYKDGRYGVIDDNAKQIIPMKYAYVLMFGDDLFVVKR